MVVVAIAGGSGNLGRALVDALKAKGGSEVVVLARKVRLSFELMGFKLII